MGKTNLLTAILVAVLTTCGSDGSSSNAMEIQDLLGNYTEFRLQADLTSLSSKQRQMLPLLVEAAKVMDDLFWLQAFGNRDKFFLTIKNPQLRQYVEINYGPWDRLSGNEPFMKGVGVKPLGARFYPSNMGRAEFKAAVSSSSDNGVALRSLYTLVKRDEAGKLTPVSYHKAFSKKLAVAAGKLRQAATLAENVDLKRYLELRAQALVTDDYQPSDFAWMQMKDNTIDVVIGAIETYEDQLFGYKAAYEAYVLVKDQEWSNRLEKYTEFLPALQQSLPVPQAYKNEIPGVDSDLNVYDVIYYAGDCNAGSKTIAINLPNDEDVQLKMGTRRLQLKNAMKAKFDKILIPIANTLIAEDQRKNISFDAFFTNTMFHEIAHGLGIKSTVDGQQTVRKAMREHAAALEEGKADILGLYMLTELRNRNELELGETDLVDSYVTFLAGIFRSIRFGAASAHGVANLLRFHFFRQAEAFSRDANTGTYRVNFKKMEKAVRELSRKILIFQGDGNYEGVQEFIEELGAVGPLLQQDLDQLKTAGIPVDVVFEQGL